MWLHALRPCLRWHSVLELNACLDVSVPQALAAAWSSRQCNSAERREVAALGARRIWPSRAWRWGSDISTAARLYRTFQRQTLTPRPEARAVLTQLKESGFRTGLISNCPGVVTTGWDETSLAALIAVTIFSCAAGLQKPHPDIYHLACAQLDVRPEQCLYIGDGGSRELSGAAAVGMHPVLLRVPDEDPYTAQHLGREAWDGSTISTLYDVLALVSSGPERLSSVAEFSSAPPRGRVSRHLAGDHTHAARDAIRRSPARRRLTRKRSKAHEADPGCLQQGAQAWINQ